ncbi:MAG TPA: chemotaxis protein CheD [Vicinamibacterales bacterium]|nr:chemotaxis protein CheD [Vicinamibacterales bacterium]
MPEAAFALPLPMFASPAKRLVVGIGEFAVSDDPNATIVTHALGSCVAVCLWDPLAKVAGLIHVLLPSASINPVRAKQQPAAFADTGLPIFFQSAYKYGVEKKRCRVQIVGGADVTGVGATAIGKRNVLAIKSLLWRNGVLIEREAVGGSSARSVSVCVTDGELTITSGGEDVSSQMTRSEPCGR